MSEIEKPILTVGQDQFLKGKSFDTYKKKLEVLSRAYSANAMKTINGFSLDSEDQYRALFEAVFSGVWEVDTGMRYVNITQSLGLPSFLVCRRDEFGDYVRGADGHIAWDIVSDLDGAELFTEDQIKVLVPKEFCNPVFIVRELDARKQWGTKQSFSASAAIDDVEEDELAAQIEAAPFSEPETVVKPRPEVKAEPITKSQRPVSSQPAVKPRPEVKSESVVKPRPEVESEPVVKSRPVIKSEPIVKPRPAAKAEANKKDYTKESLKIINATIDSFE